MNLTNTLSAVSILAAILTFFFSLAERGINEALELEPADHARAYERLEQRRNVRRTLLLQGLPLFAGAISLFYICLPQTCDILRTSTIYLWRFDIIRTLFVLLEICLLVLVLLTSTNMLGLIGMLKKLR